MNFRTDMADERNEKLSPDTDGIECEFINKAGVRISRITVLDERGEQVIGKPAGKYITLDVKPFGENAEILDGRVQVLADELKRLIPDKGTALVAGLGNEQITPDALGPRTASMLLATRHLKSEIAKSSGMDNLRSTAAIIPGVMGRTGIETVEIIEGIA